MDKRRTIMNVAVNGTARIKIVPLIRYAGSAARSLGTSSRRWAMDPGGIMPGAFAACHRSSPDDRRRIDGDLVMPTGHVVVVGRAPRTPTPRARVLLSRD